MLAARSSLGGLQIIQPNNASRGALAVGAAHYTVPGGALYVDAANGSNSGSGTVGSPYATVAYAVTQVGSGGTIVCRAGSYHESFQESTSCNPCTVMNYPGEAVWFDGSVVVSSWSASGGVWVHSGVPTQFSRANSGNGSLPASYNNGDPYAALADQVFVDGTPLTQVADATTPAAGQFSVDYNANTITIATNPSSHEVRVSDLRFLVVATQPLSWKGVGVRRYSPDVTNAVGAPFYYGGTSGGSLFENVVIEYSALAAVNLNKPNISLRNCTIQSNTYSGIGGTKCDGMVIQNCVISGNNTGQFKEAPATGGIKITDCVGLTIDNNLVINNNGAEGIWTDVSCVQTVISNNYVSGAHRVGIQQEETDGGYIGGTQYRGVVAGNIIVGGQYGINLLASGNLDVYNNAISGQSTEYILVQKDRANNTTNNYLPETECPWDSLNVTLANNVIGTGNPVARVRVFDTINNRSADDMNALFLHNQFLDSSGGLLQWGNNQKSYTSYSSVAAMQAAEPANISGNQQSSNMADSAAAALPANVASALGVATGSKKIGPYITS